MKKFAVSLLLVTLLFACSKSKSDSVTQTLYGSWELRVSYSGWGGSTQYSSGNGNTLTFNTDGTYYARGMQHDTGTFTVKAWTNNWGQQGNLLHLNGRNSYEWEMHIRNDTLDLDNYSTIADGGALSYKKL